MSVNYTNLEMQTLRSQGFDSFIIARGDGSITLHIFLTLIHYESITSMALFLLLWFSTIFFWLSICDDAYLGDRSQLGSSPV